MNDKNKIIITSILLLIFLIVILTSTYALITKTLTGEKIYKISVGNIDLKINNESNIIALSDAYPTSDNEGMKLTPYTFELTNNSSSKLNYDIKLSEDSTSNLGADKIKFYLEENNNKIGPKLLNTVTELTKGVIEAGETKKYSLRIWLDLDATTAELNKTYKAKIEVSATQVIDELYVDNSGASSPVIKGDLIPVKIDNKGVVTQADLKQEWYNYDNKEWANAVILENKTKTYQNGEVIPEDNIQSYFVWIPRYRYKIFNEGNYTTLTGDPNKSSAQEIEIQFEDKDMLTATGSKVGEWLTHPAFTSFNSNGMWVGKFESGYKGATSTSEAQVNANDPSKLIIKPNVYSWRNITVGNAFNTTYNYKRDLNSHMMKNTEWGAVAYLSHSKYGYIGNVRINNNKSYITGYSSTEEPKIGNASPDSLEGKRNEATSLKTDGTYTKNYLNPVSIISSTTNNYSGIYDMAGGAHEFVMGYALTNTSGDSSGLNQEWLDNPLNQKYYDKYTSTSMTSYNSRILGDATGEMGPFFNEIPSQVSFKNSWYKDFAHYINSNSPWFLRGGDWTYGTGSGIFAYIGLIGNTNSDITFRVVLTP